MPIIAGMAAVRHHRLDALVLVALVIGGTLAPAVSADHGDPHVTLEADTKGCTGVLPSTDGNTDMRVVGGTMEPGGTAIFEITYPLNASSVGKNFTILACAFINDVAALKYTVTFVPSNQAYVLRMTFAVPSEAPVGGLYCNYAKTTAAPTASQASQRKAGPACFVIRPPSGPAAPASPPAAATSSPPAASPTATGTTPRPPSRPVLIPDTSLRLGGD